MLTLLKKGCIGMTLCLLLVFVSTLLSYDNYQSTLVYPPFSHCFGLHKVGKSHLFLILGTRVQFRNPQGLSTSKLEILDDPNNTNDDNELTVFGVNNGQNLVLYNLSLTTLGYIGGIDTFKNPHGIAANAKGFVYVADSEHSRIVCLKYTKEKGLVFLNILKDDPNNPLKYPWDVKIASDGRVFVTDKALGMIRIWGKDGEVTASIRDERLINPTGLMLIDKEDRWNYTGRNSLSVIVQDGKKILEYSFTGSFIREIGIPQDVKTGMLAYGVYDRYASLFVTDTSQCCIHKWNKSGEYLCSFGKKGTGEREFDEPRGIAIWRRFGQVFIAERAGAQYFWIGTDIISPRYEHDKDKRSVVRFMLTEPSLIEVFAQSLDKKIYSNNIMDAGNTSIFLPELSSKKIIITATPLYSSTKYFKKIVELDISS